MPSGQNKKCSVCSAPPEVLTTVEARLRDGTELRVIETESGFSRSALDRHRNKCMKRAALVANRDRKLSLQGKRVIVELAHPLLGPPRMLLSAEYDARGTVVAQSTARETIEVRPADLRATDVLLTVEFEDEVPPREMPASLSEAPSADIHAVDVVATMEPEPVREPETPPMPHRTAPAAPPSPPSHLFGELSRVAAKKFRWD